MERTCACGATYVKKRPKASNKCPKCIRAEVDAWKARNPDHSKRAKTNSKARDISKFRTGRAAQARNRKARIAAGQGTVLDILRLLAIRAKHSHRKRVIVADGITPRLLVQLWESQHGICALSGMPMMLNRGNLRSVSLDRKDSDGHYTPENIQLVCKWANLAKGRHTDAEFLSLLSEYQSLSLQTQGIPTVIDG